MPSLSVIVPTYNRKAYLGRTLDSIQRDVGEDVVTIVVDDGSTDGTREMLTSQPVLYYRMASRSGVAAARNAGLRLATTKYVTFVDSDDLVAPGGLRSRMDWLSANPGKLAVGGQMAGLIDEWDQDIVDVNVFKPLPSQLQLAHVLEGQYALASIWPYVFDRTFLASIGWFDERLTMAEDLDYLIRVLKQVDIPVIQAPSIFYRLHSQNLSVIYQQGKLESRALSRACGALVALENGIKLESRQND